MMDGKQQFEATQVLRGLKLVYQKGWITLQQCKTLKGQVIHGDVQAAMDGLTKLLNRRRLQR